MLRIYLMLEPFILLSSAVIHLIDYPYVFDSQIHLYLMQSVLLIQLDLEILPQHLLLFLR
jgi:hypothetical protein